MGPELLDKSAAWSGWKKRRQPVLGWAGQYLISGSIRRSTSAGVIMTQVLPFADPRVLGLYAKFEGGVYKVLS